MCVGGGQEGGEWLVGKPTLSLAVSEVGAVHGIWGLKVL